MTILKHIGGLIVGAIDGAVIAMFYAVTVGLPEESVAGIGASIGGIIGLIFPTLAFIVCIPIAIYFIKHYREHDPRRNPKNKIN